MTAQEHIEAALAEGITFAEIIAAYAKANPPDDYAQAVIAKAQDMGREGELEVDDTTIASGSDSPDGDYVLAWLWVPHPKPEPEDEDAPYERAARAAGWIVAEEAGWDATLLIHTSNKDDRAGTEYGGTWQELCEAEGIAVQTGDGVVGD